MTYAPARRYGSGAVNAYAAIGLETEVMSASPEHLITLLFAGARAAIGQARLHLENGRIAERGQAISKAIRIVSEGLQQSLNMEAGGELATNLNRLYDFTVRSLLKGNLDAQDAPLLAADRVLADLQDAWTTSVDPRPASVQAN